MADGVPLLLLPHREYVRVIRPLLPPEAFETSPRKLWGIVIHTALFVGGVFAVGQVDEIWVRAAIGLGLGLCVANLAFYGHDLSHGSIVRTPWLRHVLELWIWSLRLMPSTLWRRLHNETHHVFSNTPRDCDRQLMGAELTFAARNASRVFGPFDNFVRWNPLVIFSFVTYTLAHVGMALANGSREEPPSPYTVSLRRGRRWRVALEFAVGVAIQVGVLALVGWDWSAYVWCGPVPIVVSSGITMAYIFTNHFLNPITESADPVLGTTSLSVPRWVDWLHLNFSYHTEHHIFPNLNSDFYPLVGDILAREFPERYNRISMVEAWRRLWSVHLGGVLSPSARLEIRGRRL